MRTIAMATLVVFMYVLDFFTVNLEELQTKYNNFSTQLYETVMSGTEKRNT